MAKVCLVYRETPQSDGVPQLEDPTGRFSRDDLRPLESEVARCYQQLAQSDGQVIAFTAGVAGLPTRYRLRVRPVKNRRCPVLELVEIEEPAGAPVEVDVPDWPARFVEGADRLLRGSTGDRAERAALSFVLEELRELDQGSRQELTALFLAGYLYMAENQCAKLAAAADRVALYRLASRVVDAWCASRTSGSASVPRQSGSSSGSRLSYQWMPRVLARLLGLHGEEPRLR